MRRKIFALIWLMVTQKVIGSYLQNDTDACSSGELPCDDGQCINWKSWCDGPQDCSDASDERYCRVGNPDDLKGTAALNNCSSTLHFMCETGLCIPRAGRCDDLPNCENREDEERCDFSYESSDEAETLPPSTTTPPPPSSTSEKPPPPPPSTTTQKSSPPPSSSTTTTSTTAKPPSPPVVIHIDTPSWIPSRVEVLRKSVRHMIDARDMSWGWGRSTPKMVTAMSLANESYFDFLNQNGLMTKKQLEVQLALDLMRHSEKPMKMLELAHYVHALIATCHNPRDFHGVNVLKMLKKAMADRQARGLFVSPIAYVALCNANEFSDSYIRKMKNMAYRRSEEQRWLDVQAYALLAISCRTQGDTTNIDEWKLLKTDVAKNISEWQQSDGSFGTLYSTALALQALIAAEEAGTESSKGRAMTYLLLKQDRQGSFGNDLDNYYVLPALNMKSLASLRNKNCKVDPYGTQGTEAERQPTKKNKLINVHYSLWIGGEKNEIHTITLAMPRRSNFLQVMEAAEKINPRYKHEILKTPRGNVVHSIAGRVADMGKNTYWTLYKKVPLPFRPQLANVTATIARLKLLGAKRWNRDISKLQPKDNEHLAFWYKPYL
ncbi:cobalamin binding intrinsic factor-like [Uloborus diversus]|uniref:cobalamin binding intrinsic factor-like n=1 Tax=Uloborus diversus TaxID=327109 RepID=UPI00240940D3|nr:cobalamin binding intrinsic factor-like [Uloborus diversus]